MNRSALSLALLPGADADGIREFVLYSNSWARKVSLHFECCALHPYNLRSARTGPTHFSAKSGKDPRKSLHGLPAGITNNSHRDVSSCCLNDLCSYNRSKCSAQLYELNTLGNEFYR